jgi:hypothetical protein
MARSGLEGEKGDEYSLAPSRALAREGEDQRGKGGSSLEKILPPPSPSPSLSLSLISLPPSLFPSPPLFPSSHRWKNHSSTGL